MSILVTVATVWPLRLHHLHGAAPGLLRVHLPQGAGDQGSHLRRDCVELPSLRVGRVVWEVHHRGVQQRHLEVTDDKWR